MIQFPKMKKALSISVCYAIGMVALAFCANAAESMSSSIDFSNQNLWGQMPRYGLDDKGGFGTTEQKYWWAFGDGNASVITNYEAGAERYAGFAAYPGLPNPQPPYMSSGDKNRGYLEFQSAVPLARTFSPLHSDGTSDPVTIPSEDGLFIDKLVKFATRLEAADAVPTIDVKDSAKFMCWLSAPEGAGVTNFVITAGRYAADGALSRVNYVVTNEVQAGRWYRLTARAFRNAATRDGVKAPCFALYLDGVPMSCAAGSYAIGEDQAEMDDQFAGNALYAARALFPPIRAYADATPQLTGLAVMGCGCYDDLGVVNGGNPLAYEVNSIDFAVSLNTNAVTNVICTVQAENGAEPYFTTNSTDAAEIVFPVAPGDTVRVVPLTSAAYSLAAALSLAGNVAAVESLDGYEVKMISGESFSDASRVVARINVGNAYFSVNGELYESVEEAMEAAAAIEGTLKLENDVVLDPDFSVNGQMRVRPTYRFVFDLNGRTLTGQNFRSEAAIYDQGNLTVIDSVGGGQIVAPGTAIEVVSTNAALEANYGFAKLTLGDEIVRGDFTVKGRVRCTKGELQLLGGTYLTPWTLEPTNGFYLAEYLASERFGAECEPDTETIAGRECHYWSVTFDGRLFVTFESEVGAADPAFTNVYEGARLLEPAVTNAVGYTTTNWYDTATGKAWDFAADTVGGNLTLRAQQRLDTYSITYDVSSVTIPDHYTVESLRTTLSTPEKDLYTFGGWRDAATGLFVTEVGIGAKFVGTDSIVTGNLQLVAQWLPNSYTWENSTSGNSESNGTYSGSWSFTLPANYGGFAKDAVVVIDEVCFGIVNPHLYPKTAECLEVTTADGAKVISAARAYKVDEETKEYLVGSGDYLKNGRARVSYGFTGLKVKVGAKNSVRFCTVGGETATGFLRLVPILSDRYQVFGKCTEAGGDPKSEDYLNFRPVYEVTGHPEEVNHE